MPAKPVADEAKKKQTCINCQDSFIHLGCPRAALLDEGLNVALGSTAIGLHTPALLMCDGQRMGGSPLASIMSIQVMLMGHSVVDCNAMTTCKVPYTTSNTSEQHFCCGLAGLGEHGQQLNDCVQGTCSSVRTTGMSHVACCLQ